MARRRAYRAISRVDPKALAEFQAGIRKRYSDAEILRQLKSCAERLGRSPTMREFSEDAETTIHPQTVIERFGSWNRAKRAAGLVPRRFATKEELLEFLRPQVAKWWLPDDIVFVEGIPKTSVGKFDKKVLREDFKSYRLPAT